MSTGKEDSEWRAFERLVARIEADAREAGIAVTSPDHIRCNLTGALREVDASIRQTVDGVDQLITIECRRRRGRQDVTWIEQLATKRSSIAADKTIAVSASGFSAAAYKVAAAHGIELKSTHALSIADLNPLARIDCVWFSHRVATIQAIGLRDFWSLDGTVPDMREADYSFTSGVDPHRPIFTNIDEGHSWSIDELWRQLQAVVDPFADIVKGASPILRSAWFPYPGNVEVMTPEGPRRLGDVVLTIALSVEVEQITLGEARKLAYRSGEEELQRVEFESRRPSAEPWRMSLQLPDDAADAEAIRITGSWPSADQRPEDGDAR